MIGLVGFGRFGRLMTRHLSRDFRVLVYNRSGKEAAIREAGGIPVARLAEVCARRLVLLSVPISTLPDTLRRVAPLLRRDALVMDVCSVKMKPVEWMRDLLPESVGILATHPMFGPDSAADSLLDRKIVLCPVRLPERGLGKIRRYLEGRGLNVIETTPEEHDRQISVTLSLTHFIGRSLEEYGAREFIIDTEGYKRLLHILGVVTHDTWELFEDMNRYNPFAKPARHAFMDAVSRVEGKLAVMDDPPSPTAGSADIPAFPGREKN